MFARNIVHIFVFLSSIHFQSSDSVHARCQYYTSPSFRSFGISPAVRKCCCHGEALESGEGCVNFSPSSEYIARINASFSVGVGFPNISPEECNMTMVTDRWFISERGSLVVNAFQGDLAIVNYCIDDILINSRPSPRAVTCTHELKKNGALPISAFRTQTIGKCCPRDEHFLSDTKRCVKGAHSDMDETIPGAPNNTQLGFTGIPKCEDGEYSHYLFKADQQDHVRLERNLSLILVKMDEHCVEEEMIVNLGEYCLDYSWNFLNNQSSIATALLCRPKVAPKPVPMTSAWNVIFLSLSCVALILTVVFLIALQAKGMLSHVPQIGLLAPRTHLTYVGTLLIGFIILAIAMNKDFNVHSNSCWTTAAFLIFFLLSGFFWNTALCCESLLIVMRIGHPGWKRYSLHCCWAYGIPGIITFLALALDGNRQNLPCNVITPRIGRFACFISDSNAQILYFYLPVFITIIANVIILTFARHVRMSRLRRLELGAMHHNKKYAGSGGVGGKPLNGLEDGVDFRRPHSTNNSTKGSNSSIARFGLSTRETHMLWWESVSLALWSGILWLLEIIWFSSTNFNSVHPYNWQNYLWNIPAVINSLKGIGVFLILIIMPKDSRYYLLDLVSNLWEKCGGKPLKKFLPPTRRSSTSTNTTATTSTNLSPSANVDKERISLSSSDTQLSSHNTSMNELREAVKNSENISESTSVPENSDGKICNDKLIGKTPVLVEAVIEQERKSHSHQHKNQDTSPKKNKSFQPPKPPRKSLENLTKVKGEPAFQKLKPRVTHLSYSEDGNRSIDQQTYDIRKAHSDASLNSIPPLLPQTPPPSLDMEIKSEVEFSSVDISDIIRSNSESESSSNSGKSNPQGRDLQVDSFEEDKSIEIDDASRVTSTMSDEVNSDEKSDSVVQIDPSVENFTLEVDSIPSTDQKQSRNGFADHSDIYLENDYIDDTALKQTTNNDNNSVKYDESESNKNDNKVSRIKESSVDSDNINEQTGSSKTFNQHETNEES